jgi:hypothetical protein
MSGVRLAVQIDEEASIKTGTVVPDIDVSMIGKWASVFFPVLRTRMRIDFDVRIRIRNADLDRDPGRHN